MNQYRKRWNIPIWNFMICCATTRVAFFRRPVLFIWALLATGAGYAQVWSLSADELARLDRREVLVWPEVEADRADGSVRAAIEIAASAERIFRTMTDCAQALQFVPHLTACTVLETAPDGSWQTIEHEVSYAWFLPHVSYVFRARYEPFERVSFSSVRGDFRTNDAVWELSPRRDGAVTLVTYSAQVVPKFYVPRWMVLASLKRDLPQLMQGLRTRCESP
jgi:ribosome-associated toxin RatA of RatAB toxin-antitoxin module